MLNQMLSIIPGIAMRDNWMLRLQGRLLSEPMCCKSSRHCSPVIPTDVVESSLFSSHPIIQWEVMVLTTWLLLSDRNGSCIMRTDIYESEDHDDRERHESRRVLKSRPYRLDATYLIVAQII